MRNTSALLLSLVSISVLASEWPQWLGPQRDGIWREDGIIEKFNGAPKLKWKVDVGGGYSGPAVADGRVFLTDRQLAKGVTNPANKFTRGRLAKRPRVNLFAGLVTPLANCRSVRKTRPSATAGPEYPPPTSTFHFSFGAPLNFSIIPSSRQIPSRCGPSHCGHSLAKTEIETSDKRRAEVFRMPNAASLRGGGQTVN